jgi:two-component system chemotaxis sensor kinase CheA
VTVGADTEIDRQALDLIRDPLIHIVRNCADHGLESPEERRRAGKPETGCIRLSACRKADHVLVEIADDGRGLDADRIRHTALQSGLATAAELAQIPEVRLNRFIFRAGFSTADAVTSVSGRGVGLDVVRANIRMVGGTVDVRSRPGRGTTFLISIPISPAAPPLTSYPAVPA